MTAIATVLDEFVFEPLIERAKIMLVSNQAIDKRQGE